MGLFIEGNEKTPIIQNLSQSANGLGRLKIKEGERLIIISEKKGKRLHCQISGVLANNYHSDKEIDEFIESLESDFRDEK